MTVYEKLMNIQQGLKAPKGQRNTFGGYNYRSCEDILEAVKPLLKENKATLIISDEIINLGDRFYIKAITKLVDAETKEIVEVSALARENESQKGMNQAQITGSVSSYARKYALNGLFCIDDTRDSDTMDNRDTPSKAKGVYKLSAAQIKRFYTLASIAGINQDLARETVKKKYGVEPLEMNKKQYDEVCKTLEAKKG